MSVGVKEDYKLKVKNLHASLLTAHIFFSSLFYGRDFAGHKHEPTAVFQHDAGRSRRCSDIGICMVRS